MRKPNKGKVKVGNHQTIERAFNYKERLLKYFCASIYDKEDAKDLVQLAIIRASRHVSPDLPEEEFEKRLFIIAREIVYYYFAVKKNDFLEMKNTMYYVDDTSGDDEISLSEHVKYNVDDGIDYQMLLNEFRKRLPPRLVGLLDMLLQGYELKEIAEKLGRSYYGVNTDLSLLRRMLRQMMVEKGFVVKKKRNSRHSKKSYAFSESIVQNPTGGDDHD